MRDILHINDLDIYLQAYILIYNIFLKEFYFYLFKNILPICRASHQLMIKSGFVALLY